jgi:hypothetical protein
MTPRQLWLFQFGCWASLLTAALHLAGMILAPLTGADGPDGVPLHEVAAALVRFPDGTERPLGDVLAGFNLAYAGFMATLGGVGLAAARRGRDRTALMADLARVLALASLALLVISLVYFFLVSTMLLAVTLVCFTLAAVRPPA